MGGGGGRVVLLLGGVGLGVVVVALTWASDRRKLASLLSS